AAFCSTSRAKVREEGLGRSFPGPFRIPRKPFAIAHGSGTLAAGLSIPGPPVQRIKAMQMKVLWSGLTLGLLWALMALSGRAGDEKKEADKESEKPAEMKVLEHFVGKWKTEFSGKKAEWTPQDFKDTGADTTKWVLRGRYLRTTGRSKIGKIEVL